VSDGNNQIRILVNMVLGRGEELFNHSSLSNRTVLNGLRLDFGTGSDHEFVTLILRFNGVLQR